MAVIVSIVYQRALNVIPGIFFVTVIVVIVVVWIFKTIYLKLLALKDKVSGILNTPYKH